MTLNDAIQVMTNEIVAVLVDNKPTIYLYGSVVLDDFKQGWSDIDIVVLTQQEITTQQAENMVELRQALLERFPGNPNFRLFEGGMISSDAFLNGKNERTVYWGTSGQRITNSYKMDSFGMAELLDYGILLYGEDIRSKMTYPTFIQIRYDIARHVQAARKYGTSVGWLLDIARGIYTLRTGKVIAKTKAGEWALVEGLCQDADALQKAVQIRKEPMSYSNEENNIDNIVIQRFADVIEEEFSKTTENCMIHYIENSPISVKSIADLRETVGWNRMESVYKNPSMTSYLHIAAYDGEKLVGYIDSVSNGVTDAYIQDLMVHPDYQGKGIGTELMNRIIAELKRRNIYMISVVFEEKLKPFYSRFGFFDMLCGQLQTYESE